MSQLTKPLGCFEISSLALGYRILDIASRFDGVKIIESSAVGGDNFLVLLQAEIDLLRKIETAVVEGMSSYGSEGLLDREVLPQVSAKLLPAIYSLVEQPLDESLLVMETDTVSSALAVANHLLLKDDLNIIELKIIRGSRGKCLAFFTSTASVCLAGEQDVNALLRQTARTGRVEIIDNPKPAFREFFNLSGRTE